MLCKNKDNMTHRISSERRARGGIWWILKFYSVAICRVWENIETKQRRFSNIQFQIFCQQFQSWLNPNKSWWMWNWHRWRCLHAQEALRWCWLHHPLSTGSQDKLGCLSMFDACFQLSATNMHTAPCPKAFYDFFMHSHTILFKTPCMCAFPRGSQARGGE